MVIDVKNIDFQIKKHKNMFFTFIKTSKTMHKNIKLKYPFNLEAPSMRIK